MLSMPGILGSGKETLASKAVARAEKKPLICLFEARNWPTFTDSFQKNVRLELLIVNEEKFYFHCTLSSLTRKLESQFFVLLFWACRLLIWLVWSGIWHGTFSGHFLLSAILNNAGRNEGNHISLWLSPYAADFRMLLGYNVMKNVYVTQYTSDINVFWLAFFRPDVLEFQCSLKGPLTCTKLFTAALRRYIFRTFTFSCLASPQEH